MGSDYEYADGLIDGVAITPAALKAYLANNCVTAEVSGALKDAVADFGEWSIGLHEIGRGASVESLTVCTKLQGHGMTLGVLVLRFKMAY